jgi:hypothetical protein
VIPCLLPVSAVIFTCNLNSYWILPVIEVGDSDAKPKMGYQLHYDRKETWWMILTIKSSSLISRRQSAIYYHHDSIINLPLALEAASLGMVMGSGGLRKILFFGISLRHCQNNLATIPAAMPEHFNTNFKKKKNSYVTWTINQPFD